MRGDELSPQTNLLPIHGQAKRLTVLLYGSSDQRWQMRNVLGRKCRINLETNKRNNRNEKMNNYLYLGRFIKRPGDLAPKGIASTYDKEKLPFNETWERLWKLAR